MARIGFLLTRTPWYDHRQYHRQGPVLLAEGHTVVYLAGIPPDIDLDYPYEPDPLSAAERRTAALTGGLNLLRRVARARLDVLQICSIELLPLGIAAKLLRLTKVVYDCREDMPSSMRDHKPRFPKPIRIGLSWMTQILEAIGDRVFDGLVTADPATAEDLHPHMPQDRKVVLYNVAPKKHFPTAGPPLAQRQYDIGIVGSMSKRTGVSDMIDAVALLRDEGMDPKVLVVGEPEPPVKTEMESRINDLALSEQFDWRGRVDHLEVPNLLYNTRIGVVSWHDYTKFRRNIANKALEFIAARMVTVATDLPSQHVFLEHDRNAMFYAPGDVVELARALSFLMEHLDIAQRLADQARRDFLSTWNLDRIKAPYTDLYDRLTREPQGLLVGRAR